FLAGPQWRNMAFVLLALSQGGHLLLMAAESNLDLFSPLWFVTLNGVLRTMFDLVAGAAMIQVAVLHPRKLRGWVPITLGGWAAAALIGVAAWQVEADWRWWWIQMGCSLMVLSSIGFMVLAYRQSPHPFTLVLRRFTTITLACWVMLSVAVAAAETRPDMLINLTTFGVMTWHVFFA